MTPECEEGWKMLYQPLVKECEALGGKVLQVKEKFGGLRFYFDLPAKYLTPKENKKWVQFHSKVNLAEERSFRVCEKCGFEGFTSNMGGWMKTLCQKHWDEAKEARG